MDRKISKEQLRREWRLNLLRWGLPLLVAFAVITYIIAQLEPNISLKRIRLSKVEKGDIVFTVSAIGAVVPAYEEMLLSPIASRVLGAYYRVGDTIEIGHSLLKLDLQQAEMSYKKLTDEEKMRTLKLQQSDVNNRTRMNDLEIQLKVSAMRLSRIEHELKNEMYLDSLGATTADQLRQKVLNRDIAVLEHQRLKQQMDDTKLNIEADSEVQRLELEIFRNTMRENKRILDGAHLYATSRGTITFIQSKVGAQVAAGECVARIADLTQFIIEGNVIEKQAERLSVGNRCMTTIGNKELLGTVVELAPTAANGMVSLVIKLDLQEDVLVRPGMKVDIYVAYRERSNILRIPFFSNYSGKGNYQLFIREGNELIKRKVELGESSSEWIEVLSGIQLNEEIVLYEPTELQGKKKAKLIQ